MEGQADNMDIDQGTTARLRGINRLRQHSRKDEHMIDFAIALIGLPIMYISIKYADAFVDLHKRIDKRM